MSPKAQRTVARLLHLALTAPLGALAYAPLGAAEAIRPLAQFVVFPVLGLSGLWMWQGHRLRRWHNAAMSLYRPI